MSIADRFGVDPLVVLDNIVVARAWNSDQQMDLICELAAHFAEQKGTYRLLVIDSIISLFRCDYSGRGELADRQQKLNQMLNRLTKISEEYNMAVFMTNQVSSDPGGTSLSLSFFYLFFSSYPLRWYDICCRPKEACGWTCPCEYPLYSFFTKLIHLLRHMRKSKENDRVC